MEINERWVAQEEIVDDQAVFIDYSKEDIIEKFQKIDEMNPSKIKTYCQHLPELLDAAGPDIIPYIKEVLIKLSRESSPIKKLFLQQIPGVLKFLEKSGRKELMKDSVLPPIFDLLGNQDLDIKEEAASQLAQLVNILSDKEKGDIILKKVIEMANDDESEDNRLVAVQLFGKLASSFGKDLCDQHIVKLFLYLGDNPSTKVRRETVNYLPVISQNCSKELFDNKLIPFYRVKCNEHLWHMRKSCVEVIVELSKIADSEKKQILSQIMTDQFLEDQNRWVKVEAYKMLGPFIATLENQKQISEKLFIHFNKMTEYNVNHLSNQDEIMIKCSFYFPAVLQVFGVGKWAELKNTLYTLIKHRNKNVKKPIACSLHEVAKIIKQKRAEDDLFEVYEKVLKDQSDDVRFGAIKNLANFLEIFDQEKKESLVEVLQTVQQDPKKWRIRSLISKQIKNFAKIYSPEIIFQYILPIATKLCNDNVNIVREEASSQMYALVDALNGTPLFLIVIEVIKGFADSKKYSQRQVFILICSELMNYVEIFEEYFLELFFNLAEDKVSNVKITLARTIVQHIQSDGKLKEHEKIKQMVEKLRNDVNNEVRIQISYLDPIVDEDDEKQEEQIQQEQTKKEEETQIASQQQQNAQSQQMEQKKGDEDQELIESVENDDNEVSKENQKDDKQVEQQKQEEKLNVQEKEEEQQQQSEEKDKNEDEDEEQPSDEVRQVFQNEEWSNQQDDQKENDKQDQVQQDQQKDKQDQQNVQDEQQNQEENEQQQQQNEEQPSDEVKQVFQNEEWSDQQEVQKDDNKQEQQDDDDKQDQKDDDKQEEQDQNDEQDQKVDDKQEQIQNDEQQDKQEQQTDLQVEEQVEGKLKQQEDEVQNGEQQDQESKKSQENQNIQENQEILVNEQKDQEEDQQEDQQEDKQEIQKEDQQEEKQEEKSEEKQDDQQEENSEDKLEDKQEDKQEEKQEDKQEEKQDDQQDDQQDEKQDDQQEENSEDKQEEQLEEKLEDKQDQQENVQQEKQGDKSEDIGEQNKEIEKKDEL